MFWFCLVLSFILSSSPVRADEDGPPSLVNLTEQPIARVHGTVNVITGDWVDQDVHETPSGPDSYPIGHSYSTSSCEDGNLSDSWNFLWPSVLEYHSYPPTGNDAPPPPNPYVVLHDAGGAKLSFTYSSVSKAYIPTFCSSGYTHISTIDHPVTRDPSRIVIHTYQSKDSVWRVTLSDGTKRFFDVRKMSGTHKLFRDGNNSHFYNLVKEILPSKNVRYFEYDKKGDLRSIRTLSSCGKYLIQKISLRTTPTAIYVKSLDGREVVFELEAIHNKKYPYAFVKSIHSHGVPKRHYTYFAKKGFDKSRIGERTWETGLVEEARFYRGEDTEIDGKKVHVPKKDRDFTDRRVSEVRTKRFRGEATFMKHGFYYDKKDPDGDYRILLAKDADNSTTTYMWNPFDRIIWSSYYSKHGHQLAKEHFVWGNGVDVGRLRLRAFYDEKKNPLFVRIWNFTEQGFPKEEHWYGLFTSNHARELTLEDKTKPHGGETITLKATWDEFGNQCTRTDPDGNVVENEYAGSFLIARYSYYKYEKIIQREFYKYDSAGCLIHSMQDDGATKDSHSLEGVKKRYITKIIPRRKAPHFGEPEKITHIIWTPSSERQLVSTEYFERDTKGRVIRERQVAFDGLEQSTSYLYDDLDRLIETTYQDGSFERRAYDEVSGLLKEKSYTHKRLKYKYDLFSRVIAEKEIYTDGTFLETTTDFDQSGRIITVCDTQGNTTVVEKDVLGRIISKKFPEVMTASGVVTPTERRRYQGRSVFVTSPAGAVTETIYSSFGKPLLVRHPEGYSTNYTYDLLGRLVESFDGLLRHKTTYDYRGRVKRSETWAEKELIDWRENHYHGEDLTEVSSELLTTRMIYDVFGRCIEKRLIDKATNKEVVEKTVFDGLGRVIRSENQSGVQSTTFDLMGRVIETKSESLDGRLLLHSTNKYDNAGRIIEASVQQDDTTWLTTRTTYGAYGLPSSVEAPDGSLSQFIYEQKGITWKKKSIDARGVVSEEVFKGGKAPIVQKVIDPFGNILSAQRTFVNCLGQPEKVEYDIYYKGTKEETLITLLEYD